MPDEMNNRVTDELNPAILKKTQVKPRVSKGALFGVLGAVVVLTIVASASYLIYYEKSYLETGEKAIQQTASRIILEQENNQADFRKFKQEVKDQQEKLQALEQHQQALQAVISTGADVNVHNDNWRLAEALYLSRLAVERIQTLKDVKTAIFQLEAADQRLAGMQDPQFMPVRKVLIDNLAMLKAVETPDREGLWLRLGALSAQVDNLTLRFLDTPMNTISTPTPSGWGGFLSNVATKLKSLVQVRSPQENANIPSMVAKITTEADGKRLKQALILVIEEARAALVHREGWVYNASLTTAEQWLAQYFVKDHQQENMLSEIAVLKIQKIDPDLPDISIVVQTMNTAIAQRSRRP